MNVFVVGVNHKTAPIELREKLALTDPQSRAWAAWVVTQGMICEAVILSTCNRTEIYGVSQNPIEDGQHARDFICSRRQLDVRQVGECFYHYTGANAMRHLLRVASSLDSMVIGEPQILGQVRQAYQLALDNNTTGPITNVLFQRALRVGKRVRRELALGQGCISINSVIVQLARSTITDLRTPRILVLGLGKMGTSTIQCLSDAGASNIQVTSRSVETLDGVSARTIPWGGRHQAITACDLVVTALTVEEYALTQPQIVQVMIERQNHPLFIVDIGLPRNVDPGVRALGAVTLYDLDDIHHIITANKQEREKYIPAAERMIDDELKNSESKFRLNVRQTVSLPLSFAGSDASAN